MVLVVVFAPNKDPLLETGFALATAPIDTAIARDRAADVNRFTERFIISHSPSISSPAIPPGPGRHGKGNKFWEKLDGSTILALFIRFVNGFRRLEKVSNKKFTSLPQIPHIQHFIIKFPLF